MLETVRKLIAVGTEYDMWSSSDSVIQIVVNHMNRFPEPVNLLVSLGFKPVQKRGCLFLYRNEQLLCMTRVFKAGESTMTIYDYSFKWQFCKNILTALSVPYDIETDLTKGLGGVVFSFVADMQQVRLAVLENNYIFRCTDPRTYQLSDENNNFGPWQYIELRVTEDHHCKFTF
jgi:hypothetical protein